MRTRWALVVLAAAGCDRMFGLAPPPIDGPPGAEAAPPDAPCTTRIAPAVADAVLDVKNPDLWFNTLPLLNLQYRSGMGLQTVGIFKFDVTNLTMPWGIEIVLPHCTHDDACPGVGCDGTCATLEEAGTFDVHAMRSDWDESDGGANQGATWNCRRGESQNCLPANRWQLPGATGEDDRSDALGSLTSVVGQDSRAVITDANAVATAWGRIANATHLSFQVVPRINSGTIIVRSTEPVCDPGAPTPHLVLTYCD